MKLASLTIAALATLLHAAPSAHAQFNYPAGITPVTAVYNCNPNCVTSFTLPANKLFVIQNVSVYESATYGTTFGAIGPYVIVNTSLDGQNYYSNNLGPSSDLSNSSYWTYGQTTVYYTTYLPTVYINSTYGQVTLQGYLINE